MAKFNSEYRVKQEKSTGSIELNKNLKSECRVKEENSKVSIELSSNIQL